MTLLTASGDDVAKFSTKHRLAAGLSSHESTYALACCAVTLLCVLVANPFAGAGFNDDWSYSHVALKFAETGRIHYNGWGAPMLLFQTLWGAAWIRLFGFSFDILRVATLLFSLGFVALVYALARKTGLRRDLACFGALIVGTSPVFIPLAASFMTDIYGCFFLTLCVYAAVCCLRAQNDRSSSVWLWVLVASGAVGGSNRQIVWVAPLALLPYLLWGRRASRRFCYQALGAFALCLVLILFLSHEFRPRYAPFAVSRDQVMGMVTGNLAAAVCRLISLFLMLLLLALPGFLCFAPLWKRLRFWRLAASAAACGGAVFSLYVLFGRYFIAPFLGNVVTRFGVLDLRYDALGSKPLVWPKALQIGLTVLLGLSLIAYRLLKKRGGMQVGGRSTAIFAIVSLAYTALLFPGALVGLIFDRHVLPLAPMLIVAVLHGFQPHSRRVPAAAWACLLTFCVYGVATTHDYASALRARVEAAQRAERLGIPPTRISAGLEYDAWSQLQLSGDIEGTSYGDTSDPNRTDEFWFWRYTKALDPEYVASYSVAPDRSRSTVLSVPFSAWMPPFKRAVIVLWREDLPKK